MNHTIQEFLAKLVENEDLTTEESVRAFHIMMQGSATPAQMAAFLIALRMKGETIAEITGAAHAVRTKAVPFDAPEGAIDTCGTGGDATGTYNISTAVALVAASCGVPVVKHGNRSVSSKSGSADVLQKLDVNLAASVEQMQQALEEINLCFLMAPSYHKAMRHIAPVRQELKLRTIFNLLGPLSNPGLVKRQLMGIYDPELQEPIAHVLRELGVEHAWIVHGADGMDELSLTGPSHVVELKDGTIRSFEIIPEEAGLERCELEDLQGGTAEENATALEYLLGGAKGPYRDIVLLNTAAALIVSGKETDLKAGVKRAARVLDTGACSFTLKRLVEITNPKEDAA